MAHRDSASAHRDSARSIEDKDLYRFKLWRQHKECAEANISSAKSQEVWHFSKHKPRPSRQPSRRRFKGQPFEKIEESFIGGKFA
jgi:hypothetical protein